MQFEFHFAVAKSINEILVYSMPTSLRACLLQFATRVSVRALFVPYLSFAAFSPGLVHLHLPFCFLQSMVMILAPKTDEVIQLHLQDCCYHRPISPNLLLI